MLRLDRYLVDEKLVESREKAQELIAAGFVEVDGKQAIKPAQQLKPDSKVELKGRLRYVGRGGVKLESALKRWPISLEGKVCADVGASTGGFTDCLLQNGVKFIYAIDVGTGQLHPSLHNHPQIILMEKTNVRYLESLPEQMDMVTIDVSFISLRLILPSVQRWLSPGAEVWALLKPQFEAPHKTHKGIIREISLREKIRSDFVVWCGVNGWDVKETFLCPIAGEEGNREHWVRMSRKD